MSFLKQITCTLIILITALPVHSQSALPWLSKVNTSVLAWTKHLNLEAELGIGQDVTMALGLGVSIDDGQYLQAAGRYYFNASKQESPLVKTALKLPLLNGDSSTLNVLAGYQLVFNRRYSADLMIGIQASTEWQVEPQVEFNIGLYL